MKAGGLKSKNVLFCFQSSSGDSGASLTKWCANFYVQTSVAKIILPQYPLKWWDFFFFFQFDFVFWEITRTIVTITLHESICFLFFNNSIRNRITEFTVLRFFPFSFYLFESCAQAIKNKETWTGYLGVKVFNFLCPCLSVMSRLFLHLFCLVCFYFLSSHVYFIVQFIYFL